MSTPHHPDDPGWFCVRTQTKREHIAAGHLRELEAVEVFCPRLRYRKATRRGKIWWVEPLFPGYLLAKFNLAEMERAVTFCQGVRGLVRFDASFSKSDAEEIARVVDADQSGSIDVSELVAMLHDPGVRDEEGEKERGEKERERDRTGLRFL